MGWLVKRFRSGGIRVTRKVYHHIRAGDAARDALDWERAAACYAKAVALQPGLAHIQVQLGHALKEGGRLDLAQQAYHTASVLVPDDREPWLYLADADARLRLYGQAAECYCRMLAIDVDDGQAAAGLATALRHVEASQRKRVLDRIQPILTTIFDVGDVAGSGDETTAWAVAFDVSDLVPFLRHGKRPTGIQRVQLEVVAAALARNSPDAGIALCCMDEASDRWRAMSSTTFLRLFTALTQDFDASRCDRISAHVQLSLLVAPDFIFVDNGALVNLGASWWLGNYFLGLRVVQAERNVSFLPFVHDLIPILHPEWHVASLIGEFTNWFSCAVTHANAFLVNSNATRRDLIRAAALAGSTIDPDDVAVVTLDAGIRAEARKVLPNPLAAETPFVLMIGTVEPRKGHDTAFAAWQDLLARGPAPRLVCVGGNGWLSSDIFRTLAEDPVLAAHVDLLSGIDDDMLTRLYDRSLFTIYPSRYEGWGLPVTEALCRGKIVVTTSASSLPEAGGDLALYVPPGDAAALASTVAALVEDPGRRLALEARIATEFRPRSWQQIADQVVSEAIRVATAHPRVVQPFVRSALPGWFYSLRQTTHQPLPAGSAMGEVYRLGSGWKWPDREGNRVRGAKGARLAFSLSSEGRPIGTIRVDMLLNGVVDRSCRWRVTDEAGAISEGLLPPFGRQWISINASANSGGIVILTIQGQPPSAEIGAEQSAQADLQECSAESVGVEGFFLTAVDADYCENLKEIEARRRESLYSPDPTLP